MKTEILSLEFTPKYQRVHRRLPVWKRR